MVKNLPAAEFRSHRRPRFHPRVGKIPWRRKRLLTPIFLPGKVHGQRSLAGYNPWDHKELDATERTACEILVP